MRRRPALRALALALPALLTLGCVDVTAPLPSDGVPEAFRVRVHGYGFGAHEVTLTGDTLRVVRRQFFDPRTGVDSVAVVRDRRSSSISGKAFCRPTAIRLTIA